VTHGPRLGELDKTDLWRVSKESYFYIEKQLIIVYQWYRVYGTFQHTALGEGTYRITPGIMDLRS
jgi:hypothetical protein